MHDPACEDLARKFVKEAAVKRLADELQNTIENWLEDHPDTERKY